MRATSGKLGVNTIPSGAREILSAILSCVGCRRKAVTIALLSPDAPAWLYPLTRQTQKYLP